MRHVYFVVDEELTMVKVGCSEDPYRRLSELQTASPHKLLLVAFFEGDFDKEADIHRMLNPARIHGEWFHLWPEVAKRLLDIYQFHIEHMESHWVALHEFLHSNSEQQESAA